MSIVTQVMAYKDAKGGLHASAAAAEKRNQEYGLEALILKAGYNFRIYEISDFVRRHWDELKYIMDKP